MKPRELAVYVQICGRTLARANACSGDRVAIDASPRFINHPIEVGWLLRCDGQPDEVIAAGLVHDVLEKTATTGAELQRWFGAQIARLVESVSDDSSLGDYTSRKRELRYRVAHSGARGLRRRQDRQGPGTGTGPGVAAQRAEEPREARPLPREPRDAPPSRR